MSKIWVLLFFFLLAACGSLQEQGDTIDNTAKDVLDTISEPEAPADNSLPPNDAEAGFPPVLQGTSTYSPFVKENYDKALKENKIILLYFYANWCPICAAEQPTVKEVFAELNDPNIIGFRVNYKDSDVDEHETALAKKFGIAYQHTKVILKDGERVLKAPDVWEKERYVEELSKLGE